MSVTSCQAKGVKGTHPEKGHLQVLGTKSGKLYSFLLLNPLGSGRKGLCHLSCSSGLTWEEWGKLSPAVGTPRDTGRSPSRTASCGAGLMQRLGESKRLHGRWF